MASSTPLHSHEPERPDKREAILVAALELFAERGFHGTAVPLVAEKAKVGAGTIYRYFESKEALVNAVFRGAKQQVAEALTGDFPHEVPPREQFRVFWKRMVAFSKVHPHAFDFLAFHHHASYLDAESRALEDTVLRPAISFLERTSKLQVTKAVDPGLLLAIVWGALVAIVRAQREGLLTVTPEMMKQAENCCWEAIRR